MTPIEGSKKENEIKVYKNLYVREKKIKPKYKEGDKVRTSKYKTKFQRGYDPTFTEEIFTISDVLKTDPINYRIKDLNGKEIKGTFYEQELVRYDKKVYKIEKILKKKGNRLFVKWLGYSDDFNSWIDQSHILL
ncbi:chromo domain-containing protein [Trichonephila clavipes]|nr:chromo domain-containing protein [Trichonephila clavipes]